MRSLDACIFKYIDSSLLDLISSYVPPNQPYLLHIVLPYLVTVRSDFFRRFEKPLCVTLQQLGALVRPHLNFAIFYFLPQFIRINLSLIRCLKLLNYILYNHKISVHPWPIHSLFPASDSSLRYNYYSFICLKLSI